MASRSSDGLLLVVTLLLVVRYLELAPLAHATPCPLPGDPVTIISNRTVYTYSNCPYPINATGTDIVKVSFSLVNSTIGSIILNGSLCEDFALMVADSTFAVAATTSVAMLQVDVDVVTRLSIYFLRSVLTTGGYSAIQLNPRQSLRPSSMDVLIDATNISSTNALFNTSQSSIAGTPWSNVSITIRNGSTLTMTSNNGVILFLPLVQSMTSLSVAIFGGSRLLVDTVVYLSNGVNAMVLTNLSVSMTDAESGGTIIRADGSSLSSVGSHLSSLRISGTRVLLNPFRLVNVAGLRTAKNIGVSFSQSNLVFGEALLSLNATELSQITVLIDQSTLSGSALCAISETGQEVLSSAGIVVTSSTILRGALVQVAYVDRIVESISIAIFNSTIRAIFVLQIRFSTASATFLRNASISLNLSTITGSIVSARGLSVATVEQMQVSLRSCRSDAPFAEFEGFSSAIQVSFLFINSTVSSSTTFLNWKLSDTVDTITIVAIGSTFSMNAFYFISVSGARNIANSSLVLSSSTLDVASLFNGNASTWQGMTLLLNSSKFDGTLIWSIGSIPSFNKLIQNMTVTLLNSIVHGKDSLMNIYVLEKAFANVSILIVNTSITLNANFLLILHLRDVQQSSFIFISMTRSSCNGAIFFIHGNLAYRIERVSVHIHSSSLDIGGTLFQAVNISSAVGWMEVLVDNAIVKTTAAALVALMNVHTVEAVVNYTVRNHSRISVINLFALGVQLFCLRHVGTQLGDVYFLIIDSDVSVSATSSLCAVGVVLFADLATGSNGYVQFVISNGTVAVVQQMPQASDGCSFFSLAGVVISGSMKMVLMVDRQSSISLSCNQNSAVIVAEQSMEVRGLSFTASDSSRFLVVTKGQEQVALGTGLVMGSFIMFLTNALVKDLFVSFVDCSISCGLVCHVGSVIWSGGIVYEYGVASAVGYFPSHAIPRLVNATVAIRNTTIAPTSPFSPVSPAQLRPIFSFANATNSTFILEGPFDFHSGMFDGIVLAAAGGEGTRHGWPQNEVLVLNCDAVKNVDGSSGGGEEEAVGESAVVPHGREGLLVKSVRTGGIGSCGWTQTASQSLTLSAEMSLTASAAQAVLKDGAALPHLARSVVAGAVGVLAVVSGPAVAMSVQVLHAQMLVSGCPAAALDDGPVDVATSPTQMSVGESPREYVRGAVVGNILLLLGCCMVAIGTKLLFPQRRAADFWLPGLLYVPYSILLVPLATASTLLVASANPSGIDIVVGLIGYVSVLAPLMLLLRSVTVNFRAKPVRLNLRRFRGSQMRKLLKELYERSTVYSSFPDSPGFVAKWEYAGVADFVANRQWFVAVEMLLGVATGVIAGMTALGSGWCRGLNVAQVLVTVGFLVALVLLRPHAVKANKWCALSSSILECVTAVLGALGQDASMGLSIVQLLISAAYVAGYVSWEIVDSRGSSPLLRLILQRCRGRQSVPTVRRLVMVSEDRLLVLISKPSPQSTDEIRATLSELISIVCAST